MSLVEDLSGYDECVVKTDTKLNARLALRQRADLLVANISTNNVLWFGHAHFRCFTFYINQFIIHSQTHTHANK